MVLRRFAPDEVFDSPPVEGGAVDVCGVYEDGQVFYVEQDGRMLGVFCGWVWDDIYKDVQTLRSHGNFMWFGGLGVSVNCCTDGLRLVVFKIERVD